MKFRFLLGFLASIAFYSVAQAQGTQVRSACGDVSWGANNLGRPFIVLPTGELCVNATVSASVTGFTPAGTFANLTATASTSASTSLPAGASVKITNTGTTTVSCVLAAGAATGVANRIQIGSGASRGVAVGANDHIACINQAGDSASNVVVVEGGSGLAGDSGGGGGGSSSNASVSATGAAVPTSATYAGLIDAGTLRGWPGDATNGGFVNIKSCASGVCGITDGGSITNVSPIAGKVQTSAAAYSNAEGRPPGMTIRGGLWANLDSWAGTALGAPSNFGTTPTAVVAGTVNASLFTGTTAVPNGSGNATGAVRVELANNGTGVVGLNAGTSIIGTAGQLPYPVGATPYTATATGTTGSTTATLAGASSVTTYLCGFSIRANATAAVTGNATVTGVITATLNFTQWTAPNASGLGVTEMVFAPCIPASGTNQNVAVVSAAPGTGGVVSVTAWGYKL